MIGVMMAFSEWADIDKLCNDANFPLMRKWLNSVVGDNTNNGGKIDLI